MQIPTITGWHRYSPRVGRRAKTGVGLGQSAAAWGWYILRSGAAFVAWFYTEASAAQHMANCGALAGIPGKKFCADTSLLRWDGSSRDGLGWYALVDRPLAANEIGRVAHRSWVWTDYNGARPLAELMHGDNLAPLQILNAQGVPLW